ncbi:GntR family transcriptional regulator [Candidatus Formimonas warabiya]|uniref:HTH gntR-type domain-containing protein n=1 Tax=Formimonas warabiya TaxID=1761012 RepID=A0A3G1KXD5_FORW1|nr:GntR family transcriptional regulator [Candidatus Formimonas warabiya]ATW27183.1 hypothetical protein DCMF_22695 [Candidatus Formimonas warabiya]
MSFPIYIEIYKDLKQKIFQGDWNPGDMLWSENELAQKHQTTRLTVRKSLAMLENEGFIYSVPGKGYYIVQPDHSKYTLLFNELNNGEKNTSYSKLLGVDAITPDPEVKQKLHITGEKKVVVILRLVYSNEEPIAYDVKYLPYDRGKPIVEKEIQYATFPDMVAKKSSPFAIKKELSIFTEPSKPKINKMLRLKESEPLLVVEQSLYDQEDQPIGWGKTYYKGDYMKIKAYSYFVGVR